MSDYLKGKNIRLRCKKSYHEAHTHIIIGKVEEETDRYLAVRGRTFHFGKLTSGIRSQVTAGIAMIRAVPWENIEVVHWLGEKTNWEADFDFDKNGNLILKDRAHTVIAESRDGLD